MGASPLARRPRPRQRDALAWAGPLFGAVLLLGACPLKPNPFDPGEASTSTEGDAETLEEECTVRAWYPDNDSDGWGGDSPSCGCEAPGSGADYVAQPGDCDDGESKTHPDKDELCDGIDNDCDGQIDELSADNGNCEGCRLFEDEAESKVYWVCSNAAVAWEDAEIECRNINAASHLVYIDDDQEMAFLREKIDEVGFTNESFWIGMSVQLASVLVMEEKEWVLTWQWNNGNLLADWGYGGWACASPGDPAEADFCATVVPVDDCGQIQDRPCGGKLGYICEAQALPEPELDYACDECGPGCDPNTEVCSIGVCTSYVESGCEACPCEACPAETPECCDTQQLGVICVSGACPS